MVSIVDIFRHFSPRFIEIYRSPEVKAFTLARFDGTILTTW
jgi:ABC-type metal ion transport system substrate-binding protein